jgi:hypothetical protein
MHLRPILTALFLVTWTSFLGSSCASQVKPLPQVEYATEP